MNRPPLSRPDVTRRDLLKMLGIGGAAIAAPSMLTGCVGLTSGVDRQPNGAGAISGSFDWKRAKGETINILQTPHPYQQAFQPLLNDFTELTGITVKPGLVGEADYFTKLNTELSTEDEAYDVFMTGAYFLWVYGPPGWIENLKPWIDNQSATSDEYDFEDIYPGLRTSTSWDFEIGSPLGTGGQWAIPWGWETNVIAYNKKVFAQKGLKPADDFDNFIQLAADLTDRKNGQYGVAFRGSKSWATIHAGFMTQFSRQGAHDYKVTDGKLVAKMNSPAAVEFTKKWVELAKNSGPSAWTSYDYTQCTEDLGNGAAMMVYDADSATYPKNKPGNSKEAGNLAWYPGPHGPDGSYATNIWTWSLGMNAASKKKLAAWLFIQWATGKEANMKAVRTSTVGFADPVRKSVFDQAFKQTLSAFPGYLETHEKVVPQSKIQFTPQPRFLETTDDWAGALQAIYDGADPKSTLDDLATNSETTVNSA